MHHDGVQDPLAHLQLHMQQAALLEAMVGDIFVAMRHHRPT